MTTESADIPATEALFGASFLLGMSMAALYSVQSHLIQGEHKEALTVINNAIRELNEKVQKHFYTKPEFAEVPE